VNFPTNQRKYFWKRLRRHVRVSVADARENKRWLRSGPRILIARHAGQKPYTQHYYLNWLAQEFPELRSLFELRLLPCKVRDWSRYRLYIPWFPDSAIDWMAPAAYARALDLEAECEARGIPVINSIAHTPNRIRTVACVRLAAEGIRTPHVAPISNPQQFRSDLCGLNLPLIVRDDCGHGQEVVLVKQPSDLEKIPFDRMRRPVAAEWVDVSGADGLFRKCRFAVAGTVGVRRHLIVSRHWEVRAERRVASAATRWEELDYLQAPATEHELFQRARKCLDLQWAAFDYSFDSQGEPIVWETNSFPILSFPDDREFGYTHPYVERSLAAMTHMYLTTAGMPVPEGITTRMNLHTAGSPLIRQGAALMSAA
jgi:hypothetical protein